MKTAVRLTIAPFVLAIFNLSIALVQAQSWQSYTNTYGIWGYDTTNGSITIRGYYGPGDVPSIPSAINGLPVTSIGNYAFRWLNFTSLTIPNSVTNIGTFAFEGNILITNITLSSSLTSIGAGAFYGCSNLISVTIPSSVTSLGASAFQGCVNLTNVTIPKGITTISNGAFGDCDSLTGITVPNTVTKIGSYAFGGCSKLASISVDPLNSFYSDVDGVLFDKGQITLMECPAGKTGNYTISDNVTSIGDSAFANCYGLSTVTIPNSVTNIGRWAFSGCGLTTITIPSTVIGMGDFVFNGCSGLTSVTIAKGTTTIAEGEFLYCTSLTNITIPNSVTNILESAFQGCSNLVSVTIPESVSSIGTISFWDCTSLTTVTIPASVSSIGFQAFAGCTNLVALCFQGDAPIVDQWAFSGDTSTLYYLPGTTGWETNLASLPTMLWNPRVQTTGLSFGVRTNEFGFTITGTSNLVIVVETSSNLASPTWLPLTTNTLDVGSSYFSDAQWKQYSGRFYRLSPGGLPNVAPAPWYNGP